MNIHNLEYFFTIVEEKSISKAADRLYISQQSLSEQLKKLENEVGATLVKRGRSLELTPAGKVFLKAATEILGTYKDMLNEIADISEKDREIITLAIPTTGIPLFLPDLLIRFAKEYPECKIKITKCQPKEAARRVGEFDLYFSTLPLGSELEHISILEQETYVVAFMNSLAVRIYGERWGQIEEELLEKKELSILRDMPYILLRDRIGGMVLDQQIIFRDAEFTPHIAFQSEDNELNAKMCAMGAGAYISTMAHCRRRFSDSLGTPDGIRLYPIDTPGIDPVVIALSHRKGVRLTKACNRFIKTAKQYMEENAAR